MKYKEVEGKILWDEKTWLESLSYIYYRSKKHTHTEVIKTFVCKCLVKWYFMLCVIEDTTYSYILCTRTNAYDYLIISENRFREFRFMNMCLIIHYCQILNWLPSSWMLIKLCKTVLNYLQTIMTNVIVCFNIN